MIRTALVLAAVILILSLASRPAARSEARASPAWPPVPGQVYERPGSRGRYVTEVWPHGVTYRWSGGGKDRWCSFEAWKRWAKEGREQ